MLQRIARLLRLTQFLALVLVVGLGVMLYGVLVEFDQASRHVERTHAVIDEIGAVRLEALRSGIWLRNFVVAPDPQSLQRVRVSASHAVTAARRLLDLTSDNPVRHRNVQALDAELSTVLQQYVSAADLAERQGPAALQPLVNERVSSDSTRVLRQLLDQAEQAERALLSHRYDVQGHRLTALKKLLAAGGLLFAAVMLWATRYSGRLLRLGHEHVTQLQTNALHDPLTGLLNRRGLEERCAALLQPPWDEDGCAAVLVFDLDGFKPVNDRHSHAAGDLVLQEVARRLQQMCRGGDAVARIGGDEFVVVLPEARSREDAEVVAQRIRLRLAAAIVLDGATVRIGSSMGIALLGEDGQDLDALLRAADERMYQAKRIAKAEAPRLAAPQPAY
jgi:diguanylate cyclase (GGDEF)-like protein